MNGVWIIAIVGSVAIVAIAAWAVVATSQVVSREKTRRELMAYVAGGSLSPQDAARLIELTEQSELRKKVLDAAAWDWDSDSYHKTLDKVFDGGRGPGKAEGAGKAAAPA
ncbi:MAG: hypothetical protein L0227_06820 [Chloroflexi bacterium]|nr:hypothetical protein [Chloroflexota bacterium]